MIDLLKKRRSVRKFQERDVEKDKIDKLIEAVLLSPTSRNNKPCSFIIITDKEMLAKLSLAKEHGSAFLKNAPLGIVVIADTTKSDVWIEDASIASILLQMESENLGLKSCWIQIRKRFDAKSEPSNQVVKRLLNIPENFDVESIIAVGYPDEIKDELELHKDDYKKIRFDKF